ncbi:helix-turn-helix domain-containing protein [Actinomyces oris]|uniref:helix-turn-helix domain-containing protein n=1 Tax=Actinomyces oris TaxID=544580 RepID=UPI000A796589|nr:helix-turn-helix domain-containing protein [Actinomyces oris]
MLITPTAMRQRESPTRPAKAELSDKRGIVKQLNDDGYYCPIDLDAPFVLTDEPPDYNSIPYYWRRVAGAGYCKKAYISTLGKPRSAISCARTSVAFEAVPEPNNAWDPCAVRLDLNGKKAGYVNASAAPRLYSIARYWELQGKRLVLPGVIWFDLSEGSENYDLNSWVALPTVQEVKNHIPVDLIIQELVSWWKNAPQDIRDDLEESYFHLSHKVHRHLTDNHHLIPHVPLEGAAEGPSPLVVDWALAEIRSIFYEEKAEKQALERQQFEADVVEKVRTGMSYTATAKALGVSPPTVSKIAKKYGIQSTRNTTDVARIVERCRTALSLQSSGMSVAEVGEAMGVSARSAEKLLGNGRFYASPRDYPERLRLAERQLRGQLECDLEISADKKRQAHRDAAVLTYLRTEQPQS